MVKQDIINMIELIIEETHAAVLSTVDSEGFPHSRWMTPGLIEERTGALFMISALDLAKINQIQNNPRGEMLFQTMSLEKIINVSGRINILDNPSIRSEVLESIGKHLHALWKINESEKELVVLELIIERATLYNPISGLKTTINFSGEYYGKAGL
jgi:general stress protein 26